MALRPKELLLICEKEMQKVYGYKISTVSFNILKPGWKDQYIQLRTLARKTLRKIVANGIDWLQVYSCEIEEAVVSASTFEDIAKGQQIVNKAKSLVQKVIVAAEVLLGEGFYVDDIPTMYKRVEEKRKVWVNDDLRYWLRDISKTIADFTKKTDALYRKLDAQRRADPVYQAQEKQRRAENRASESLIKMSEKEITEYNKQQDKLKIQELEVRFTELSGREASHSQVRFHMGDSDLFNPDDLASTSALLTCWREVITDLEYKVKYKGWIPVAKL